MTMLQFLLDYPLTVVYPVCLSLIDFFMGENEEGIDIMDWIPDRSLE